MKKTSQGEMKFFASLWSVLALNTLVGLGLLLIGMLVAPRFVLPYWWRVLIANQVFAHVIGGLAAWLVPKLALVVHRWHPAPRWITYIAGLVCIGIGGSLLANLVLTGVLGWPVERFWANFLQNSRTALIITILIGIAGYIIEDLRHRLHRTSLELRTQQLERETALKLAAEARLASLQSRVQPHFLFNTINSILALIQEDPKRAEQMLERLARLLRFSLESEQHPQVALSEELRLVDDYLEIEAARFGDRLRYSVEVDPEALPCVAPAFCVQTLVENSVKYALSTRREGGEVRVRARVEDGAVEIEVRDDGPGFPSQALPEGHGLDTLRRRLEVLHNGGGQLTITNEGGAVVRLRFPASSGVAA